MMSASWVTIRLSESPGRTSTTQLAGTTGTVVVVAGAVVVVDSGTVVEVVEVVEVVDVLDVVDGRSVVVVDRSVVVVDRSVVVVVVERFDVVVGRRSVVVAAAVSATEGSGSSPASCLPPEHAATTSNVAPTSRPAIRRTGRHGRRARRQTSGTLASSR